MRKKDNYRAILELLEELHRDHPSYEFGRHISMAFAEYGDMWGVSDKEALFALQKYKSELEYDGDNIASPEYVDKILKDAEDLSNILDEEDEE